MRPILTNMLACLICLVANARQTSFENYPVYKGKDLGLTVSSSHTSFKVWAPTADRVELRLYKEGAGGSVKRILAMDKLDDGVWGKKLDEGLKGWYYVYRPRINGKWMHEVPDPYAFATGVNGKRTAIIDIAAAAPKRWKEDRTPAGLHPVDAVIYELHIRDASIHASSGIKQKGKFSGLAESGTVNAAGLSTGLDHMKELGVTHVHLLPFFDFLSVDETQLQRPQYNWGYEPLNYNVPEGSYSTDPYKPNVRIKELREMVMAFHQKDMRVVMDVVYNHTMLTEGSWFSQLVPGYYYRQNASGGFSNATACGNEIASERPMVKKYILESLEFWMREYHIDGFRFDLMGVHDISLMQEIETRLKKINPHVLLYGEGWAAGESPLPEEERALKKYASKLNGVAVFSDDIRDGIKGSVFVEKEQGFVSGRKGMEQSIRFGVVASCPHPQVDYSRVNYSKAPYATDPGQVVTYAECHDNHVLWDKLALSASGADETTRIQMHKLALGIVLTSQGIPFLHAGTEFLRSKNGNENSYNAGDSINAINWNLKTKNIAVHNYVQALLKLRREHPAFRYRTGEEVKENIHFLDANDGIVAFTLNGAAVNDSWKKILVVYNARQDETAINLPQGNWKYFPLEKTAQHIPVASQANLPGIGCFIFFEE